MKLSVGLVAFVGLSGGKPALALSGAGCYALKPTMSWRVEADQLMLMAATNAEVQASLELVNAAKSDLQAAQRYFNPSLALSANLSGNTSPTDTYLYEVNPGANPEVATQFLNQSYLQGLPTLQANWPVFNLSQRSEISAQAKRLEASRFQSDQTRQERALQIAKSYLDIKRRLVDLATSDSLVSIYQQQIEISKKLRRAGQASLIDVLNAEQQLLAYQQRREQASADIEGLIASLGSLSNQEICKPLPTVQSVLNESLHVPSEAEVLKSSSKARDLSPQINQLTAQSSALQRQAESIRRSLLPVLTLSVGVTGTYQRGQISGYAPQATETSNSTDGYALAQINWNLFDGGIASANSASAIQKSRSRELARKQAEINLQASIRSTAGQIPLLQKKLSDAKKNYDVQRKVLELVSLGYKAGYKSYLEFEIAANNLYSAATTIASTEYELGSQILNYESNLLFPSFPQTARLFQINISPSKP